MKFGLNVYLQFAYDQETNHSRNSRNQNEWETKINKELDTVKGYEFIIN